MRPLSGQRALILSTPIRRLVPIASLLMTMALFSGCDKIPKWSELTGQNPQNQQPPVINSSPPTVGAPDVQTPPPPREPLPAEVVAQFKSLKSADITNAWIQRVANLPEAKDQITSLDCRSTQLSAPVMTELAKLPNLQEIDLRGMRETSDASIAGMKDAVSIQRMNIDDIPLGDAVVDAFSRMSGLKVIFFSNCRLSAPALVQFFEDHPALQEVSMPHCTNANDAVMAQIGKLPELRKLTITHSQISDKGLAALRQCGELQELSINDNKAVKGSGLNGMQRLELLNVGNTSLDPSGANAIKKLHMLKTLYLDRLDPEDKHLQFLQGMSTLEKLILSNCRKITAKSLTYLVSLNSLRHLEIENNPLIKEDALVPLGKMEGLLVLKASGVYISAPKLQSLREKNPGLVVTGGL